MLGLFDAATKFDSAVGVVSMTPISPDDRDRSEICEHKQLEGKLAHAIGTLPERYQKVVFLYYTNDLTMKEIGDAMGVNESRVSQIHKAALKKMQSVLDTEGIQLPRPSEAVRAPLRRDHGSFTSFPCC